MAKRASTLWTRDLRLRDVEAGDLPVFFEQQRDPHATRMAAVPARDRDAFKAHWAKILKDRTVSARTIVLDGQVAGNVVSWEQDGRRLIGYWVGREYWGNGVATEAVSLYLRLEEAHHLHAFVARNNVASIRVLEKCGFRISVEETEALPRPADGVEELVYRFCAPPSEYGTAVEAS